MSDSSAKEILTVSLSRYVYRKLERHAAEARVDVCDVIDAALDDYLALIERCDPDVRALVRNLVPSPVNNA